MAIGQHAQHVRVVAFVCICSLIGVSAHYTISRLNYETLLDCGLKQRNYYKDRWWEPQCKFDISCDPKAKYRSADGSCNNLRRPYWGRADWPYDRFLPPDYEDGYWFPRVRGKNGYPLPSPRTVSTGVHQIHSEDTVDTELRKISNLHEAYGQFLDHDLTFTPQMKVIDGEMVKCCDDFENENGPRKYRGGPCFNIEISQCDRSMNRRCMAFTRSQISPKERTCGKPFREQFNAATAFLDASQVYGSTDEKQKELRELTDGLLKILGQEMLPESSDTSQCVKVVDTDYCFKAGDPRSNEHPGLSVYHTAFLREHNRIATKLKEINPSWDDERLYQESRKIVIAEMQILTYREWLPLLLGSDIMSFFELDLSEPYMYRPDTNPTSVNAFATAAFRYGHSQIPAKWTTGAEKTPLELMFEKPHFVLRNTGKGYDDLMKGMAVDRTQRADLLFSSGVVDRLFAKEGRPPLDLVALNLNRGRDHGLPPYRFFRQKCGKILGKRSRWSRESYKKIMRIYRYFENVDLFTGGLAELQLPEAMVGPTYACIIGLFFHRIKFGDRFWYQTDDPHIGFTKEQLDELSKTTTAKIICDTSAITEIQPKAFLVESESNPKTKCDELASIDLTKWQE